MYHDVSYLLSRLINGPLSLRQIYFASSNGPVPDLAYQVDFPRLEIVLEGEFVDTGAGATDRKSTRLNSSHNKISRMPSSA